MKNNPLRTFLISFRVLVLLTAFGSLVFTVSAQSASDRAWPAFWKSFSAAVNSHNSAALKSLMVSERKFNDGGGDTRDQWLRMVNRDNLWKALQRSVRSGTRQRNEPGIVERITNDNGLVFVFERGRWRFFGPMGD